MNSQDVLALIKKEVYKNYDLSVGANQLTPLYEKDDLVNDLFLKVINDKSATDIKNVLLSIEKNKKVLNLTRYFNRRNPILFAEEFLNQPEKEHSNHELEAILIQEAHERLSLIVNLNQL
jgi:hypothetical protein